MREAAEIFYDGEFIRNMDTNKYLMCFNNGVIDFANKVFREGYPEDYITKTTKINYVPYNENDADFMKTANEKGAEIFFADKDFMCELHEYKINIKNRGFTLRNLVNGKFNEGITPLVGDYQLKNIQTVFAATEVLKRHFKISDQNILAGIRKTVTTTGLKGRWQIIGKNPLTICDTGHNIEGIKYVIKHINYINPPAVHFVMGFVIDKDVTSILKLFPPEWTFYFTRASIPRALDEKVLKEIAERVGLYGDCYRSVKEAMEAAIDAAGDNDLVFIGGSTFVVAEVV